MDDDLFSTILYLVPVALVLFFRFFAGNKKARASKDRKTQDLAARRDLARKIHADLEASGRAVPLSRISGREPESQEWEPHWVSESDSDLAEAARARPGLEIRDEEGPEIHERLAFLDSEVPPAAGSFSAAASDAASLADIAPTLAGEAAPAAGVGRFDEYPISGSGPSLPSPADLSDARTAANARAAAGPFPGSVERLPPLKRAVVMAEILGPPKGA